MPVCQLCGSLDFDLADGAYYCMVCQTQSQDIREEEHDEDNMDPATGAPSLLLATGKKTTRKQALNLGRPWMSYEAFQLIIQAQARALVSLGADPQLEDIVWRLWTLFLASHKIAFCDNPVDPRTLTSRDRFAFSLSGERERLPTATKHSRSVPKLSNKQEQREVEYLLREDEFYEGDNPMEEPTNIDDSPEIESLSSEEEIELEDGETVFRERKTKDWGSSHHYLITSETPAFVLLALRFTNPLVMSYDVIRWLQEDKIPLLNAHRCLLPDMKYSSFDFLTFSVKKVPPVSRLTHFAASVAVRLGIKALPPVDVCLVAQRFIVELRLPSELHGLLRNFFKLYPLSVTNEVWGVVKPRLPDPSLIAMACVVLPLKLLFVLDDKIELEVSNYGRQLMKLLNLDQPLFLWDEWQATMEREARVKNVANESKLLLGCNNVKLISDVDEYIKHSSLISQSRPRSVFSNYRVLNRRSTTVDALENVFRQMAQRVTKKKVVATSDAAASTSRDTFAMANDFENLFLEEGPSNPLQSSRTLKSFSDHSLAYITDHSFVEDCLTRWSDTDKISDDWMHSDRDNDIKHRRQLVADLATSMPRPLQQCTSYLHNCQGHASYRWLIKLCADHIYCSPEKLDAMVRRLQLSTVLRDVECTAEELKVKAQFYGYFMKSRPSINDFYIDF